MKKIPLTQGKFALVDDDDFEHLNQWKWCFCNGYAVRGRRLNERTPAFLIKMHRVIMNTPNGMETDHINGERLDNRRSNLRICESRQNGCSQKPCRKRISKYKGVSILKLSSKWRAHIKVNYKQIHLGCFEKESDAAKSYNEAAKKYFGEFAYLNEVTV